MTIFYVIADGRTKKYVSQNQQFVFQAIAPPTIQDHDPTGPKTQWNLVLLPHGAVFLRKPIQ